MDSESKYALEITIVCLTLKCLLEQENELNVSGLKNGNHDYHAEKFIA